MYKLRHFLLLNALLLILLIWSLGLSFFLGGPWKQFYLAFLIGGVILFIVHYFSGTHWLVTVLQTRRINSNLLEQLCLDAGLQKQPALYLLHQTGVANAFTVSFFGGDSIFITPEIWQSGGKISRPIFAHEIAHIKHGDSIINGFVYSFEQLIAGIGRLWMLFVFSGPSGWILLLFFWPLLLILHLWSRLTVILYKLFTLPLLRQAELAADQKAARWTSPAAAINALQTINNFNNRDSFFAWKNQPFSTHPSFDERINNLRELTD